MSSNVFHLGVWHVLFASIPRNRLGTQYIHRSYRTLNKHEKRLKKA